MSLNKRPFLSGLSLQKDSSTYFAQALLALKFHGSDQPTLKKSVSLLRLPVTIFNKYRLLTIIRTAEYFWNPGRSFLTITS